MKTINDKIKIGTQFRRYSSKVKYLETVIDIYVTKNQADEIVKVEYLVEHLFMGQKVTDLVVATTILRSL